MTKKFGLATLSMVAIAWISASGCATQQLSPFTHKIRKDYNLADSDIRNLQYYVSSTITLQRALSSGEVGVTPGHTLRIINDKKVEEVKINPKTPGIAESASPESMEISFEKDCRLTFGARNSTGVGGNYQLYGNNWKGSSGDVNYCGHEYQAVDNSGQAYLLIDLSKLSKFKKESRTVKGRKLPHGS